MAVDSVDGVVSNLKFTPSANVNATVIYEIIGNPDETTFMQFTARVKDVLTIGFSVLDDMNFETPIIEVQVEGSDVDYVPVDVDLKSTSGQRLKVVLYSTPGYSQSELEVIKIEYCAITVTSPSTAPSSTLTTGTTVTSTTVSTPTSELTSKSSSCLNFFFCRLF